MTSWPKLGQVGVSWRFNPGCLLESFLPDISLGLLVSCPCVLVCTMVYRWLYTYSPIFCIEFVRKLSRQSVSPSTDHKFASSLSVNCHDSQFHRLPTMKFASSLSVNCHDSQFHRLPTIKLNWWSIPPITIQTVTVWQLFVGISRRPRSAWANRWAP